MVRHPLYLGWALVVFGVPDMTTSRFLFACISTAYLVIAIPWEERSMVDTFGDSYRQYAKRGSLEDDSWSVLTMSGQLSAVSSVPTAET